MDFKKFNNKKKYIVINLLLFAFLYLSVTFNKESIRPYYGNDAFWGILTGSYSNFAAAYIISLFPFAAIFAKKLSKKKSRLFFYGFAILVFLILTLEEINPFFGVSKVYDMYDIIASGLGSLFAIITFELIIRKKKNDRQE